MSQQNMSKPLDLPVKRKRGRPRKDENMPRPHPPPPLVAPAPPPPTAIQPPQPATATVPPVDHTMVGQAVTCIIDGVFDNGYLLSTRLGPDNAILRGIVFQQGHVAPVTPENDVAPHLEMCTRSEFPIPPANPRNPVQFCDPDQSVCVKQAVVQNYENAPQAESLRLVEQDDVMQVFEVSKEPRGADNEYVGCDPTAQGKDSVIEIAVGMGNMNQEDMTGMESEHGNRDMTGMESEHGNKDLTGMESEHGNKDLIGMESEHGNQDMTGMESEHGNQDMTGMESEHGNRDLTGMEHEPVKEPEELIIAGTENQQSLLLQENKDKTGEVNNIDANQAVAVAVGVDLSLTKFSQSS